MDIQEIYEATCRVLGIKPQSDVYHLVEIPIHCEEHTYIIEKVIEVSNNVEKLNGELNSRQIIAVAVVMAKELWSLKTKLE